MTVNFLVLLLPICFALAFFFLRHNKEGLRESDGRIAFLYTAAFFGFLVVVLTEILSLFRQITFLGLLIVWGFIFIASVILWVRYVKVDPVGILKKHFKFFMSASYQQNILILSLILIFLLLGLTVFVSPPNNWDSLTYHMGRVSHWIQNQSVAHYPTTILRQLSHTPFSEFAILHLQVLSGGDHFANFVQLFALIGCCIAASLVARQFGLGSMGQTISAVIVATIPMGILQATSTQNDCVAGFWLISFIYFMYKWFREQSLRDLIAGGVCLGLGFLTKNTVYVYAVPFILIFAIRCIKKYRFESIKYFSIVVLCVLCLNLPHFLRNYAVFGNFVSSSKDAASVKMSVFEFGLFVSNVIRNAALHLGTPFDAINAFVEQCVYRAHDFFGIDGADLRSTLEGRMFYFPGHPFHEDHAGNLLHLLFAGVTIVVLFVKRKALLVLRNEGEGGIDNTSLVQYLSCVFAGFVLFCLMVKWQPYHSRLHLPLFILMAPVISTVIVRIFKKRVAFAIGIVFLVASLPWVLGNQSRPIIAKKNIFNVPRINQYFKNNPGFQHSYVGAIKNTCLQGCSDIGLQISGDTWEYPLWIIMAQSKKSDFRMEHVDIKNEYAKKLTGPLFSDFSPCAIVTDDQNRGANISFNNKKFVRTMRYAFLSVYFKDKDGSLARISVSNNFYRLLEFSSGMEKFLKAKEVNGMPYYERIKILSDMRREQQKKAQFVDLEELGRIYPNLRKYFEELFLEGLRMSTLGYNRKNPNLYNQGERLILKWDSWLQRNLSTVKRMFEADALPTAR